MSEHADIRIVTTVLPVSTVADPMAELHEMFAWIDRHRKTVLCPPDMVTQVRALIDHHSPVAGLYDVHPSAYTNGYVYIIDPPGGS